MDRRLRLFDLAGADDAVRFSPNCWRVRLALAHKDLPVATVPWRFVEKDAIAFSGQGRVPVLVDDERCVADSWSIAEYLEDTYPERPSLFGSAEGRALARFLNQWVSIALHPAIARSILPDVLAILHEKDRAYFRSTREAAFGISIESLRAARDESSAALHHVLRPLRDTLSAQPFLAGKGPLFPDHIAFGAFQWARVVSQVELFSEGDPVAQWCARMLDAYDGLARLARRAA